MSSLEVFLLPLLVECSFIGGANDGPAGVASRAVSHQMPSLGFALGAPTPYQVLVCIGLFVSRAARASYHYDITGSR